MPASSTRINWLDSCKGATMILVVMGHIAGGYMDAGLFAGQRPLMKHVFNIISSFHMPLFFVLSGYIFYRAYCVNRSEKSRSFRLSILNNIYVYFLFSCIEWLLKMLFSDAVNTRYTVKDLIMLPINPIGPYWYLYVLILYYLLFYRLAKTGISPARGLLVFLAVSIAGSIAAVFTDYYGLFEFARLSKNIVFFALGVYIAQRPGTKLLSKASLVITSVLTAVVFVCVIVFKVNMFSIPVAGIVSAGCISLFTVNLFMRTRSVEKEKVFSLCGRYALEIYVTHSFITAANRIILFKLGITVFWLNVLVNLLMATFIPVLCAFILKKIKLHQIVFRPFTAIQRRRSAE